MRNIATDFHEPLGQVVIPCGGQGTRLGAVAAGDPKPMVPVGAERKPVLQHSIEQLERDGARHFVLVASHRAEAIQRFAAELRTPARARVEVVVERTPRGTAGALLAAAESLGERLDDRFLVLYGDVFLDASLVDLWRAHRSGDAATILVRESDHPWDSDLVVADTEGRIVDFIPVGTPRIRAWNRANAGAYVISRDLLELVPADRATDCVRDLFPAALAAGRRLQAHALSGQGFLKDMGTPERLASVEAYLEEREWIARARTERAPLKTVFLDRDGVLMDDLELEIDPARVRLLPGAGTAVAKLNRLGYRVIVVTNQPAIARGVCDEAGLETVHARMRELLAAHGASVEAILYCPHHPETHHDEGVASLRVACRCRKPGPGLMMRAVRERGVDLRGAVLIGDRAVDVEAAHRAGIRSILVGDRAGPLEQATRSAAAADHVYPSLLHAVDAIARGSIE